MSGTAKTGEEKLLRPESSSPNATSKPTREDTDIIGIRTAAEVVDGALMFILNGAIVLGTFLIGSLISGEGSGVAAVGSLILGTLVGLVSLFAYNVALEGWWNGQTIGKRVLNIQVVQEDGSRITPTKAAIRAVPILTIGLVVLIPFVGTILAFVLFTLYLIAGLGAIAMSDKRQRVFDRIAGTVVVRRKGHLPE